MTMAGSGRMRAAAIPLVGALLLLPACAGTAVHDLSMAPARSQQIPGAIGVRVTLAPDIRSDPDVGKAAQRLQTELVKAYRKAGLPASVTPYRPPACTRAITSASLRRSVPLVSMSALARVINVGRDGVSNGMSGLQIFNVYGYGFTLRAPQFDNGAQGVYRAS